MSGRKAPTERTGFRKVPLRPWMKGNKLSARHWQEGVDGLLQLQQQLSRPTPLYPGEEEEATPAEAQRFQVVTVGGDYVGCRAQSGAVTSDSSGSPMQYVAKPYLLRRTPFDGLERDGISYEYATDITRTATDADDATESQVVVPSYVEGDVLWAVRGITGGTGAYLLDGTAVDWLDINADGRAWAKE